MHNLKSQVFILQNQLTGVCLVRNIDSNWVKILTCVVCFLHRSYFQQMKSNNHLKYKISYCQYGAQWNDFCNSSGQKPNEPKNKFHVPCKSLGAVNK